MSRRDLSGGGGGGGGEGGGGGGDYNRSYSASRGGAGVGSSAGGGGARVEFGAAQASNVEQHVGHPRLDALLQSF